MSKILKFKPQGKKAAAPSAICSFCSKGWQEVAPMMEGPNGICICWQCIELGQAMIDQFRELEKNKHKKK